MKINKILFALASLIQISLQYQHYSYNLTSCDCFDGFYNNNGNCQLCPNNSYTYYKSKNISDCYTCKSSSYYLIANATSSSNAICQRCPNNSITTYQNISNCSQCDIGFYRVAQAVQSQVSNPLQATVCQQCPNYSISYTSNKDGVQACNFCQQGFFVSEISQFNKSATCSLCPLGYTSGKLCRLCAEGYYRQLLSPRCMKCPPNTTTLNNLSIFCICKQNTYMTRDRNRTQQIACEACPNGSGNYIYPRIVGDQSQCDICQEGFYLIQPHQDPIPATKQDDPGTPGIAAQCYQCPNNSSSDPGTQTSISSCYFCPKNFFMTKSPTDNDSAYCQACPNNTGTMGPQYEVGDQTQCNICIAGYFMVSEFQHGQTAQCKQCPPGTSSFDGINSYCFCNDVNAIFSVEANSCLCKQGYFGQPGTYIGSQEQSNSQNSSKCTSCPAGYYSNESTNKKCIQCDAGYYSSSLGSPVCIICNENQISNDARTSCQDCGTGMIRNNHLNQCICQDYNAIYDKSTNSCVCSSGYIKKTDTTECIRCPNGTYKSINDKGIEICENCGYGSESNNEGSSCDCIDQNSYQQAPNKSCICKEGFGGQPSLIRFFEGCKICDIGQFLDSTSGKCSDCPIGTYSEFQSYKCTPCKPGTYASNQGNYQCSDCAKGSTNTDDFSGCKCFDENAQPWSQNQDKCRCAANHIGDASLATITEKNQCKFVDTFHDSFQKSYFKNITISIIALIILIL
ncbi:hypothetical protein ABPG74_006782 [Tetrahymena malaccensis]